jgi:hypothetical protein
MVDEDAVGADRPGNHYPGDGGNVLRKSGDIRLVGETDPLWQAAARSTIP